MAANGHRFRDWRTILQNDQLTSQISSILLQRYNWSELLQNLNLSSKLTAPLFLQILRTIQTDPLVSFQFFNWTKANLGFEPDLQSSSHLIKVSLGAGSSIPAHSILDDLVQSYPSSALFDSMVEACQDSDSHSRCLSLLIEAYGKKGLFREGLQVFDKMRVRGFSPSTSACNELLDAIQRQNEIRTAWCFYGVMVRNGLLPNRFTWQLIARIFGKCEKPERVGMILDHGIHSSEIYETLVDCLSKKGNFVAALDRLNEMRDRKLDLGFTTLSSILDGASRHENSEVIDRTINIMVEMELISKGPLGEYNNLIEKLCGIGKSYAAEMFFREALKKEVILRDTTYCNMLRTLSLQGRRDEAIWMYRLIAEKCVTLDDNTSVAFSRVVLSEEQFDEVSELLMDVIRKGFSAGAPELSRFLVVLCRKRKWIEAEEMLYTIIDRGVLPDSFCCSLLMEHYCCSGQLGSAMSLHEKMENLDVSLDVTTYNVLLNGLVDARRVGEAVRVFDHMRKHEKLSSEGFVVVIQGLCCANELRNAMKLHDEMLKVGLKPDIATYKRLILAFK